jgi:tetratricopeptide (TPR) repeat protein
MAFGDKSYGDSVVAAERAAELAPNNDVIQATLGMSRIWAGKPLDGLRALRQALRLSPRPLPYFMGGLGLANYVAGRREEAVRFFEQARAASPDVIAARVWLIDHYELSGQHDAARRVAQEVLRDNPRCTTERVLELLNYPSADPDFAARLRRAGFPSEAEITGRKLGALGR